MWLFSHLGSKCINTKKKVSLSYWLCSLTLHLGYIWLVCLSWKQGNPAEGPPTSETFIIMFCRPGRNSSCYKQWPDAFLKHFICVAALTSSLNLTTSSPCFFEIQLLLVPMKSVSFLLGHASRWWRLFASNVCNLFWIKDDFLADSQLCFIHWER